MTATDRSTGDRAEGGLPVTSAHPRPPSVPAGSHDAGHRSTPLSAPPADEGATAPIARRELMRRYRAGASVSALAKEFGASFDWVAQRIIAARARRDQPSRRTRRRPADLDSDDWLGDQLAGGAGVRDLSRRLHVTPATVRNALRRYAARRAEHVAGADARPGPSDPQLRFAAATVRVERATVALERARRMQASAVSELHRSGLTIAAIADRLGTDEHLVETLVAPDQPCDSDQGH